MSGEIMGRLMPSGNLPVHDDRPTTDNRLRVLEGKLKLLEDKLKLVEEKLK
jgi:hypothetical protein